MTADKLGKDCEELNKKIDVLQGTVGALISTIESVDGEEISWPELDKEKLLQWVGDLGETVDQLMERG